tara:strand:+ start:102 stop:224 length:123 start_codon:yes stop_codon:yes gene_type:complete
LVNSISLKEELIQRVFRPLRVEYYIDNYNYDIGNDEYYYD